MPRNADTRGRVCGWWLRPFVVRCCARRAVSCRARPLCQALVCGNGCAHQGYANTVWASWQRNPVDAVGRPGVGKARVSRARVSRDGIIEFWIGEVRSGKHGSGKHGSGKHGSVRLSSMNLSSMKRPGLCEWTPLLQCLWLPL